MTPTDDDGENRREFGELIDGLRGIAGRIDRARYPGRAWPAPRGRRRIRLILWPALAAGTAAAIILLAIVLPTPKVDEARPAAPPGTNLCLRGPTDIDPAMAASEVTMEMLTLSMPSAVEMAISPAGGFQLYLPTFPSISLEGFPPTK